jgi:hypothetical protein
MQPLTGGHTPQSRGSGQRLLITVVANRLLQVESTLSMQALQPRVKEMQAKYANDPERLQVGWGQWVHGCGQRVYHAQTGSIGRAEKLVLRRSEKARQSRAMPQVSQARRFLAALFAPPSLLRLTQKLMFRCCRGLLLCATGPHIAGNEKQSRCLGICVADSHPTLWHGRILMPELTSVSILA